MMRCVFVLILGLAFLPPALAGEAEAPRRLVATELCADQWLLQLAEPHEIAALSYQAALPALSVYAAEAQGFARHDGSAEAILALSPSLVLAGAWTSPRLLRALERLGVPSLRLAPAERLAQWPQTVRMLAAELRTPPAHVAALLARVPPEEEGTEEARPPTPRPRAMIYHAGGYSSGGGTLAHDMVEAAGAEHLGAQLGAAGGWVHAPLERLLADAPQLLILDAPHATQARQRNLAKLALEHGALRRLMAQTAVYRMSEPAWLCLTPQSFLAKDALARAVRQLAAQLEAQP